jgi:hypothetical protein
MVPSADTSPRVFNVMRPDAQMKIVCADSHYEREELVEEVLLAPYERVVVDTLFPDAGKLEVRLEELLARSDDDHPPDLQVDAGFSSVEVSGQEGEPL